MGVLHTEFVKYTPRDFDLVESGATVKQEIFLRNFDYLAPARDLKRDYLLYLQDVEVYLQHNYTTVMDDERENDYTRMYVLPFPGSTWFFEFFIAPSILGLGIGLITALFDIVFYYMDEIDEQNYDDYQSELLTGGAPENFHDFSHFSETPAQNVLDDEEGFFDYIQRRDIMPFEDADPEEHYHEFQKSHIVRVLNQSFYELKTFSIMYPVYRLFMALMPYSLKDFLLFTNSGKAYISFFRLLLYIPVAFYFVCLKFFIFFAEFFFLPMFLKVFFFFFFVFFVLL